MSASSSSVTTTSARVLFPKGDAKERPKTEKSFVRLHDEAVLRRIMEDNAQMRPLMGTPPYASIYSFFERHPRGVTMPITLRKGDALSTENYHISLHQPLLRSAPKSWTVYDISNEFPSFPKGVVHSEGLSLLPPSVLEAAKDAFREGPGVIIPLARIQLMPADKKTKSHPSIQMACVRETHERAFQLVFAESLQYVRIQLEFNKGQLSLTPRACAPCSHHVLTRISAEERALDRAYLREPVAPSIDVWRAFIREHAGLWLHYEADRRLRRVKDQEKKQREGLPATADIYMNYDPVIDENIVRAKRYVEWKQGGSRGEEPLLNPFEGEHYQIYNGKWIWATAFAFDTTVMLPAAETVLIDRVESKQATTLQVDMYVNIEDPRQVTFRTLDYHPPHEARALLLFADEVLQAAFEEYRTQIATREWLEHKDEAPASAGLTRRRGRARGRKLKQ